MNKIEMAKQNILQAIEDYNRHIDEGDSISLSDEAALVLAHDSVKAKQELRELFRKSPSWDEELDAIALNGNRTHEPVASKVYEGVTDLLVKARPIPCPDDIYGIARFFAYHEDEYLPTVQRLAPKAWRPGKKLSRVLHGVCKSLGIVDETKGSWFQKKFAEVADEMNSRKLSYKLFLSLNPSHFLTMSNPHGDDRGEMLVSCHSLTCRQYPYNNGCTGYARDAVTFIAFTVDNPTNKESLNNRKITRQLFMYEPGNGVLLQSRLYTTNGGTDCEKEEYKLYRDLVQREIALLEGEVNLWTKKTMNQWYERSIIWVETHPQFGGYADWVHYGGLANVSVLKSRMDMAHAITVGEAGICFECGDYISKYLRCRECLDAPVCAYCGDEIMGDTHIVYNNDTGEEEIICETCSDNETSYCNCCDRRVYDNYTVYLSGIGVVCDDCVDEFVQCDSCNDYENKEEINEVLVDGEQVHVCNYCHSKIITECKSCGNTKWRSDIEDGLCPECFPRVSRETLGRS